MMQTSKEKVLEACYQIAQVNHVAPAIEYKWEWIFNREILYLHHGDIQYEDYKEMLPFCLEILTYSLTKQSEPADITWHKEQIESAKADRVILGDARITINKHKKVLDSEAPVFNELVAVYGVPGGRQITNAVLIGNWEARVRDLMEKFGLPHKEAEVAVAFGGKPQ